MQLNKLAVCMAKKLRKQAMNSVPLTPTTREMVTTHHDRNFERHVKRMRPSQLSTIQNPPSTNQNAEIGFIERAIHPCRDSAA